MAWPPRAGVDDRRGWWRDARRHGRGATNRERLRPPGGGDQRAVDAGRAGTAGRRHIRRSTPTCRQRRALADEIDAGARACDGVAVASFIGAAPEPRRFVVRRRGGREARARRLHDSSPRRTAARAETQPNEIVVNEAGAAAWHTGVGRKLHIHTLAHDQMATFVGAGAEEPHGPTIDANVVGISRGVEEISDVPEPIFFAGPGFLERWGGEIAQVTAVALVNADDRARRGRDPRAQRAAGSRTSSPTGRCDRDDFAVARPTTRSTSRSPC